MCREVILCVSAIFLMCSKIFVFYNLDIWEKKLLLNCKSNFKIKYISSPQIDFYLFYC